MLNLGEENSYTYPHAQPFPSYNAYLPSPSEDQNILAPTNQHAIPIYMPTPPLFVRDSTDKTTTAVVPEIPSNPFFTSSSTFLKSHSDYSKENLEIYDHQQVAPTGQHDHPQITRKRSSGSGGEKSSNASNKKSKDRHSKIVTTTRPRHRRMRLSIDVAREFFDLQDKLKFERASKTVEWLLRKAKADIEKLFEPENEGSCSTTTTEMKTPSNSDSCEGASGSDEIGIIAGDKAGTSSKPVRKERKRYKRLSPKRPAVNPLTKELRGKARERARERTKGKMSKSLATLDLTTVNDYPGPTIANPSQDHLNQQSYQSMEELRNDFNQNMIIADPNPFDQYVMLQVSGSHERSIFEKEPVANCYNFQGHIDPLPAANTTSAPFFNPLVDQMQCWNPTLIANSQHNFVGFATTATGLGILEQSHVSDYPLSGKSWEVFSSQNLF